MDLQLNVPAICTDVIYWEDNISFADQDSCVRAEAIGRMEECLQMAENYGSMVNIGWLRGGKMEGVPKEHTH